MADVSHSGGPDSVTADSGGLPIYLAWSGGKDCSLALHALRADPRYRVTHLLTTFTDEYDRASMHGVRRELLWAQAAAAGLPMIEVGIPAPCRMEEYSRIMGGAMREAVEAGIAGVAYGDLFLEDVRSYREERLSEVGLEGIFPLWGADTRALAHRFIALGFRARIVCIDTEQLDKSFIGRAIDHTLLDALPDGIDPCGENGEFHSFVWDAPYFESPVAHTLGHVEERERFVFQELHPQAGIPTAQT